MGKRCIPEFKKRLFNAVRKVSDKLTMLGNQKHDPAVIYECPFCLNQQQITQSQTQQVSCKNFIVRLMFSLTFSLIILEKWGLTDSGPIPLISYCNRVPENSFIYTFGL